VDIHDTSIWGKIQGVRNVYLILDKLGKLWYGS